MRKVLALVLMLLYGISSSGMLLTLHYCHQDLSSFSLYSSETSSCCCDEDANTSVASECNAPFNNSYQFGELNIKDNDDCCNTTVLKAKINNEQTVIEHFQLILKKLNDVKILSPYFTFLNHSQSVEAIAYTPLQHYITFKGRWQNIPLYKISCQFIYYS